jgi:hypothetical protein
MNQYAVTAVFYVKAEDEEQAKHIVDNCVWEKGLDKVNNNESWSIVDTTEVKF